MMRRSSEKETVRKPAPVHGVGEITVRSLLNGPEEMSGKGRVFGHTTVYPGSEIGYHIHKKYWRQGYGKEAARAARDWAFQNTGYDAVYSYMKYTNVGSYSTAIANGMKKVKEYPDPKNTISYAYAITRKEWEALKAHE